MAEITVDSNPTSYATIGDAIKKAGNGSTIHIGGAYSSPTDSINAGGSYPIRNKVLTFKGTTGKSTDSVSIYEVRTESSITFEGLTLSTSSQIKFTSTNIFTVKNADVSCAGNFSHVGDGGGLIDLSGAKLSISSLSNSTGLLSNVNLSNSEFLIGTMTDDKQLLFGKSNLAITSDLKSTIRCSGNVQNRSGVSGSVINITITNDDLVFLSTSEKKTYQLLQVTRADKTVSSDVALKINNEAPAASYGGYTYTTLGDHGMYLTKQNTNTVYIGSSPKYGYYGEIIDEGTENEKLVGLNAGKTTSVVASDTTNIYFEAGNSDSYGNLNLSTLDIENDATLHAGAGTVTLGALTTKTGKTLTVTGTDGAATLATSTITNNSAISIMGNATLSATGSVNNSNGTITIGENSSFSSSSSITNNGGTIEFKYVDGEPADQKFRAGSVNNSNGTISIDLSDFVSGTKQITNFAVTNGTIRQAESSDKTASFFRDANNFIWVTDTSSSTIYVNTVWPQKPTGGEYTVGEYITGDIIWGVNSTNILKDGTASDAISQVTSGKFETVCIYNVGDASGYDFSSTGITGIDKDVAITAQKTDTSIVIKQLGVTKNTKATVTFKDISLTAGSETFRAYGVDSKPGGSGDDYFSSKIAFDGASYTGPGNGSSDPYKIIAEKYAAIELTDSTIQDTKIQSMGGTVSVSGSNIKDSTISTTNNNGSRLSLTGTEIAPSTFDNSNLSLTKDTTVDFSGYVELKNGSAMTVGSGITVNATNTGTLTVNNSSIAATSMDNTGGTITIAGDSTLNVGGDGEGEALNGGVIGGDGNLTLGAKNKLNNVNLGITGTLTNNGAITVSASQNPLTANGINNSAGTITVNAADVVVTGGMRKVIDLGSGSAQVANLSISGNDDVAFFYDGEDYWLIDKDASRATLYVNSAWSGYAYGKAIEGETRLYYGYNAFSSFRQALTVAADREDATEIRVMDSLASEEFTDDIMAYLQGSVSITSGGEAQITLVENGEGGRKDLCFVPASGKTISIACPIVMGGSGSRPSGIWLNYGGAGTSELSALIDAKSFVGVDGTVNVNSTARITATDGDLQFGRPRDTVATVASVTGTKTDSALLQLHGGDYQIDVRGIQLAEGTMTVTDTKIKAGTLSVTDTENLDGRGGYSDVVVMDATNTTWDLGDMKVLFYTDKEKIYDASSTLNFTKSVINIGSSLKNVPYQTTDGHDEGDVLRSELAMEINLHGSVLNVGTENNSETGTITNAGTITMDVSDGTASELYANSITNNGTITMDHNSILIANSITNNATFQVLNGSELRLEARTRSGGGDDYVLNNSKNFTVTNSTFKAALVNNYGIGTITVTNSTFDADTVNNNSSALLSFVVAAGTTPATSVTTLLIDSLTGSAIQTKDGVTLKNSTIGGTVKAQSGATLTLDGTNAITTLDLSEAAGATMDWDWQDKLTFTGFGSSYANKFTIAMEGYDYSKDGKGYLLLDSADGSWTEEMYKSLLTNTHGWEPENEFYKYKFVVKDGDLYAMDHFIEATIADGGIDADAITHPNESGHPFGTINGATSVVPDQIVVKDGTYGTSNNPVFNGVKTTIEGGSFTTHVGGGIVVESNDTTETTQIGSSTARQNINFNISGGSFSRIVYAGDRLKGTSIVHRYGDITTTIDGGTFEYRVAGGMAYTLSNYDGTAKLFGNVTLNINGGTFNDWIYGGCIAATKVNGTQATITGNVTVKINASDNVISLASLAVGSQGPGNIGNGTNLVLTGNGAKLTVSGEIWGASSGGYYTVGANREFVPFVDGHEVLSFTGFTGALNCAKIRGFDTVTCDEASKVGINPNVSLSDVKNWTFEYGAWTEDEETVTSGISGNFTNDFTGDALELKSVGSLAVDGFWTVLENSKSGAFNGFGGDSGDMTVKFYLNADDTTGTSMEWQSGGYYSGSNSDGSYKLALDNAKSPTKMILTRLA